MHLWIVAGILSPAVRCLHKKNNRCFKPFGALKQALALKRNILSIAKRSKLGSLDVFFIFIKAQGGVGVGGGVQRKETK